MKMKAKLITVAMITLFLASMFSMTFNVVVIASEEPDRYQNSDENWITSTEGEMHETGVDYPPLPPGTTDIKYVDLSPDNWSHDFMYTQSQRVRFSPDPLTQNGGPLMEVRVEFWFAWVDSYFHIDIVDIDTGYEVSTGPIFYAASSFGFPGQWEVYDTSSLGFIVDGDFYIELIGHPECDLVTGQDHPSIGRSDMSGDGGATWTACPDSEFYIAAVIGPPVIPVYVDIKPGSWPNPLNVRSRGKFAVAICGTEDFDAMTIDPATIRMHSEDVIEGVPPLRWSWEDVATPYTADMGGGHALEGDGYMDLVLFFNTREVAMTVTLTHHVGETLPLILRGNLFEEYDGAPIEGQDNVRILG